MEENMQNNENQANVNVTPQGGEQPGKGQAIACLVCGIVSVICWFFGWSALASVVLGIVGIVLAGNAKKAGYVGGMRTAGFVLSIVGLVVGAVVLMACVACVGAVGATGAATQGIINGALKALD